MSTETVVVDASALVELLLQSDRGKAVVATVRVAEMIGPDLVNLEVLSVLRRWERSGALSRQRVAQAVGDLVRAPIRRFPTLPLVNRVWAWRNNLTAYDASYVALAEYMGCSLVTADARLGRAVAPRVAVIVV